MVLSSTPDHSNAHSHLEKRRSEKYLPHTKPVPQFKIKKPAIAARTSQQINGQYSDWFRITLYEITESRSETIRVGTLFSQNIAILSGQLAKTIRLKWDDPGKFDIAADINEREIRIEVSPKKTLLVVFDAPNKQSSRAVSQHFSRFMRTVRLALRDAR